MLMRSTALKMANSLSSPVSRPDAAEDGARVRLT
jgi:hypothetical protein